MTVMTAVAAHPGMSAYRGGIAAAREHAGNPEASAAWERADEAAAQISADTGATREQIAYCAAALDTANSPAGYDTAWHAEVLGIEPVGLAEIAARLGVTRSAVDRWRQRGVLPEPDWTVGGGPAWNWSTVEQWAVDTRRLDDQVRVIAARQREIHRTDLPASMPIPGHEDDFTGTGDPLELKDEDEALKRRRPQVNRKIIDERRESDADAQ